MDHFQQRLLDQVLALAPAAGTYWIAFSGGLDSLVLLHALASRRADLPGRLGAIHVDHQLQAAAADWARQCRGVCLSLEIEYRECSVQAHPRQGESPEAAARQARYQAFSAELGAGDVLLTAHHEDDQAETLLLQLLRGAGPRGLAAMPEVAALGAGRLVRPMLGFNRDELCAYAEQQSLRWIDDPSNARVDYDRNFLRHEILPRLKSRWSATAAVLARGARHQAEAASLLEELAAIDLAREQVPVASENESGAVPVLKVSALLRLSAPRRANLLRHWLRQRQAAIPGVVVLARIDRELVQAPPDAEPLVAWAGVRLRRYRDLLILDDLHEEADPTRCFYWDVCKPLPLPGGILSAEYAPGAGVAQRYLADGHCEVRFRRGGERLQPAGRREHHSLKHLFQDAGVPPWERARVPLIHRGETLIAVAGYWVCEGFQAAADEPGVRFLWSRAIVPAGSFW